MLMLSNLISAFDVIDYPVLVASLERSFSIKYNL